MGDMEEKIKIFDNLSNDQISKLNKKQREAAVKEYSNFITKFKKNVCYICDSPLSSFDENRICYHWMLRPNGIKKHHIQKLLYSGKGFRRISIYLRWVANTGIPFRNISDHSEEMAKDRIFEITIKYKSIEWSFSCSPSDYKGHSSSRFANFPHYHFQMKINDKVFIKFADFHPPLSDEDLFFFEAQKAYPKKVKTEYLFGEGMDFVLSKDNIEKIFNNMKTSNNEETATFNVQTIVEPPNGKTFSGNEISELMKESKKTGVPLSKLFRKLHGKMTSFVSPGKGVPEIKKRKRRRRK